MICVTVQQRSVFSAKTKSLNFVFINNAFANALANHFRHFLNNLLSKREVGFSLKNADQYINNFF